MRSYSMYANAILKRRGWVYRLLASRYPRLIADINRYVDDLTCPFCKSKFKTRYALYKHLNSSGVCSKILERLVELIRDKVNEEEMLEVLV